MCCSRLVCIHVFKYVSVHTCVEVGVHAYMLSYVEVVQVENVSVQYTLIRVDVYINQFPVEIEISMLWTSS